ncbi:hypothetical protein VB773_00550 [Haloarculaceae archaeon H-GB2-1]|nr:hypothetical protein [Haloarculaceae archaeon H-GB2-1]
MDTVDMDELTWQEVGNAVLGDAEPSSFRSERPNSTARTSRWGPTR